MSKNLDSRQSCHGEEGKVKKPHIKAANAKFRTLGQELFGKRLYNVRWDELRQLRKGGRAKSEVAWEKVKKKAQMSHHSSIPLRDGREIHKK